jgi:hypothetical protein
VPCIRPVPYKSHPYDMILINAKSTKGIRRTYYTMAFTMDARRGFIVKVIFRGGSAGGSVKPYILGGQPIYLALHFSSGERACFVPINILE